MRDCSDEFPTSDSTSPKTCMRLEREEKVGGVPRLRILRYHYA